MVFEPFRKPGRKSFPSDVPNPFQQHILSDQDLIYVSKSKLNHLLLGYAISSHKSQGSGSDYVISIVSTQHKRMLSRGLLYVMDTRCRKSCIDIGQIEAFETGLKVVDNDLRDTFLLGLMTES